ncbi:MAG: DUF1573 domain-containing protein [Planctomycetaceae bacterium]|jgi:hypothetical protein|nr:DUF1573 domain-containing protein [Planctomycetaceae bacterium]
MNVFGKIFFAAVLTVFGSGCIFCAAQESYPANQHRIFAYDRSATSSPASGDSEQNNPDLPAGVARTQTVLQEKPPENTAQSSEPSWTQNMIKNEDRFFDFKTVAKGVHAEHRFVLKNPFTEPVHIAGVSSSCSCTSPYVLDGKEEIQTYEETAIVARFRTDLYEGQKSATITVVIDKPYRAEFQLNVRGEIRSDVSIEPNLIKLENAKEGEEITRTLNIVYTGSNSAWKIVDFKSPSEHLSGKLLEFHPALGRITAKVQVLLDAKTPRGQFTDRLFLITNDHESRREIPILIQGTVGTVINITPQTVFLGYLKPGEESSVKSVIIRGTKPFRIKKLLCNNPKVEIDYTPQEENPPKIIYKIPVRYSNPTEGEGSPAEGKMRATIKVETDIPDLTPTFFVTMAIKNEQEEN